MAASPPLGWGRCDARGAFQGCAVEGGRGRAALKEPAWPQLLLKMAGVKWGRGAARARSFPLFPPPESETLSSAVSWFEPLGFGGVPRAGVTDLGRLERGVGLRPQPGSLLQGTIMSPVFNFGGALRSSFISGLKVGAPDPPKVAPEQRLRLCWEEGRAPAGGNENQQSRE